MSIGDLYRVKKANFRFQWETVRLYYRKSWRFALSDLSLGFASLFFNPYRTCRKNGSIYGETPPASLRRIASFCDLTSQDSWLELGSGRGKGCFWISHFIGCETVGIEKVPLFITLQCDPLVVPDGEALLHQSRSRQSLWRRVFKSHLCLSL